MIHPIAPAVDFSCDQAVSGSPDTNQEIRVSPKVRSSPRWPRKLACLHLCSLNQQSG